MNLIKSINDNLQTLKAELDDLAEHIDHNQFKSDQLKPSVNEFKELSKKRAELKKQSREKTERLNTILEFIKSTTGEESYGIFPLFNQASAEAEQQLQHIN